MNTDATRYQPLNTVAVDYLLPLLVLIALTAVGGYCAWNMEHQGHHITGMNNSVVWGLPHVFAVSLILAASGALNGATLSSVFGVQVYKPCARLSVVLSICLLIGGLLVLVLDLGRPDRLLIAMTTYNFRSIFSWNIFLYSGFIVVGVIYLATMLERQFNRFTFSMGVLAFVWRLVLTTGTGCIFGFLVGRSALDSAILAPLFIALSLVMGTAVLALVMMLVAQWQRTSLSAQTLNALATLMIWCLLSLLYFSIVHHLTNLYITQHHPDERFVLGGPYALLFWGGHVVVGVVLPLLLLIRLRRGSRQPDAGTVSTGRALLLPCVAALCGGAALVYVVVIGSQSTAQTLFPDKIVTASTFGDAGYAVYHPSLWEWGLGLGGVAFSLLLFCLVLRVLPVSAQSDGSRAVALQQPESTVSQQ